MNIDLIWDRIINHVGKEFYTKTGIKFKYKIVNSETILPYVDDKPRWKVNKNLIKKAMDYYPNLSGQDYNHSIIASSYVAGILGDKRIVD